ncbi:MAG: glycine cleavage system protein H [Gemmatimonadota bacterium]|nr:glycine cleavage system protein H [Gemmatimonadota bacterium]
MASPAEYRFPDDLFYDRDEHLWVRLEAERVVIGMDQLAQAALGPIVHVALPELNSVVSRGDSVGSLEAEKMVTNLIAPVGGKIIEINEAAIEHPRLIQDEPYGKGWLIALEPTDLGADTAHLIHDPAELGEWVTAETKRYIDNGWIDPA